MCLKIRKRVAGRSFTAMCGHRVQKGDFYVVSDDHTNYNCYHMSACVECWNKQSQIKFVDGDFRLPVAVAAE